MKNLITSLFCLLLFLNIQAQEKRFSSTVFVAVERPILSSAWGGDLSYNPAYAINNWFSVEGQLSAFFMKGTTFLSGKRFEENGLNLFGGGRFYLYTGENYPYRIYYNLLLGATRYHSIKSNITRTETILSGSSGVYYQDELLVVGIALESLGYIGLKLGVHF